jgi:DNA-damage-inducible protein J
MTTLNIRIDEKLKNNASDVLSKMGLDLSSAIKMFLNQVVVKQGVPFTPSIVDEWGDVGFKTLVDFTEIDKEGIDIRAAMDALKKLKAKRK